MKKNGASTALLAPDAFGWRICLPGGETQLAKTLDEAAAAVPAGASIHLALPCTTALLERLTLPSTNRAELEGMVQLQLEKTLPYPMEDVTSDFDVIREGENESTLISVAAHTPQIEKLCASMRGTARLPQRVTLFASHVAAGCPADQTVLCVWQEEEQLVVAICENGKVSTAQTIPGCDAEALIGELPAMLLRADLEGVPVDFASIRIEHGCGQLRPALAEYFGKPVELISFSTGLPEPHGDLLPVAWQAERNRAASSGRLKQQLQMAAFIYLLLVAGAFVYLVWLKVSVRKIDTAIAVTQPQIEFVSAQKARWNALQPAIEPAYYTVEILMLTHGARPSPDVKFTKFEHRPLEFLIEGEATSANMAIEFGEKLRAEKGLGDFKLDTPPPQILKDEKAKFRFSGKL